MRKLIPLLFFISMLTGCSTLHFKPKPEPTATPPTSTQCAWNWATQALPDLSARLEAALQTAGLKDATASAEAYGENCIDAAGKVDSFATLETDFHISVQVGSLTDTNELGNLLERILVVLDGLPASSIPGPNPGYAGVTFQMGSEELNLWFPIKAGKTARALGFRGARLFEELQKK